MNGIMQINVTKRPHDNRTVKDDSEETNDIIDESGIDNGTLKIPVASNYVLYESSPGADGRFCEQKTEMKGILNFWTTDVVSCNNENIDYDYDYIMARALRSYRQHREREKADTRKIQMRADFIKRHYPRPKTAPSSRLTAAMRPQKLFRRLDSVLVPKVPVDAISEVQRANVSEEEIDRENRRVLQIATVNINMMEINSKAKNYQKRNEGSHPWYSHSYPAMNNNMKYVRIPHAYMSASVGERDISSSLSSSRSSSTKSSPSHSNGRPQSAVKPQYNYDGGLFVHPRKGPKEDFVIHPDWVSESMSIQKLSLSKRTSNRKPVKNERMTKSMTWPGRRCKSAPPSKLRNPITWEAADG